MRLAIVAAWSFRVSRLTDHLFSLLITAYRFILFDIRGQAHDIILLSVDGIVQDLFFGASLLEIYPVQYLGTRHVPFRCDVCVSLSLLVVLTCVPWS